MIMSPLICSLNQTTTHLYIQLSSLFPCAKTAFPQVMHSKTYAYYLEVVCDGDRSAATAMQEIESSIQNIHLDKKIVFLGDCILAGVKDSSRRWRVYPPVVHIRQNDVCSPISECGTRSLQLHSGRPSVCPVSSFIYIHKRACLRLLEPAAEKKAFTSHSLLAAKTFISCVLHCGYASPVPTCKA